MNIKKITKIVTILILIATILGAVNMVFATDVNIPGSNNSGYAGTGLESSTERVIGIVQYICYAAAVILLVILGVKWLIAAPDQKADMKKSAIVYVVGAILVFAAGVILQVIRNVAKNTITT